MSDYNDGKWHGWNGGECPVDPDSLVQTIWMHKNRDIRNDAREGVARGFPWCGNEYGDIIAFRVTKPAPPKPREITGTWNSARGCFEIHVTNVNYPQGLAVNFTGVLP